jgi:Na+/H+-dicarboxylate symporter
MNKTKKLTIIALACIVLSLTAVAVASAADEYDWYGYGAEEATGLALFGLGLMCIIPIIYFIIAIVLAIWVYKDAEKRGSSGALWLIIIIFTGIIGLIIWLVVRPPIGGGKPAASSDRKCPNCGRSIPMDAKVCPYCGKDF